MPQISKRGSALPNSPIRKLVPYAEKAVSNGNKVYYLNIGQPDIKTPEVAINAVKNISQNVIAYTHSAGNESYRRKLADYYNNTGINVDFEDILITTGGSEAILFAFMSTLDPGDEIIIPEPFYANYTAFALMAGINVVPVATTIENDFALPSISEFEKVITPKTKGIVLCNPNNPTGRLYSEEDVLQLREIILKHDLYLFCDEVYREFCYDGKKHFSIMQLEGVDDRTILIDSISKRYSACGARIGAVISRNKDIINSCLKYGQARLCPPALGQIVGEAALDTPPEYFRDVYNEYVERRDCMVKALNDIPGVYTPCPDGAFYTVAKLPVDDSEKFCRWILSDFNYKKQTVMMAPASGFYSSPGMGSNEVRIAYVLKKEDLLNAIEVLKHALEAYPGRVE